MRTTHFLQALRPLIDATKACLPPYITVQSCAAQADAARSLMPLARAAAKVARAMPAYRPSTERK